MQRYVLGNKWLWPLVGVVVVVIAVVAVALVVFGGDDEAEWKASVATLRMTAGTATLTTGNATQTVIAGEAGEVRAGTAIALSDDGEGTLFFFTGTQTDLSPGSELTVDAFELAGDSSRIQLNVLAGQVFSSVEKALDADSRHDVVTPGATISIRGTQYVVYVREDRANLTQVVTVDGEVTASALEQSTLIPCGYGLKIVPGEALGEIRPWAFGDVRLTVQEDDPPLDGVVVTFVNADGLPFRYRTGDAMPLPIGAFTYALDIPGPVVGALEVPGDIGPEQLVEVPIQLGELKLDVVDEAGEVVAQSLTVRFQQGDIDNQTASASGVPMLAGPGTWQVSAASPDQPDRVFTVEVTIEAGQQAVEQVPLSALLGEAS